MDKLEKWENEYSVETWVVDGVQIWPILNRIFFLNTHRDVSKKRNILKVSSRFLIFNIFNPYLKKLIALFYLNILNLKKTKIIFSSTQSFRVGWRGKQFNRFFDPIMDYLESIGENTYLLEYGFGDLKKNYKYSRVCNIQRIKPLFTKKLNFDLEWSNLIMNSEFRFFLEELSEDLLITEEEIKNSLLEYIEIVISWSKLYEYLFKKTKAEFVFGLCYYNQQMSGMNLAAKKMGITSIDMQHGTQGDLHFAYNYNKLPPNGYNILPSIFWLWDSQSFEDINKWTNKNLHSPVLGGNPWIEYLNGTDNFARINQDKEPMLLLTLQPLDPMVDDYFLEVVALTKTKYDWWFRLHPRMTEEHIMQLKLKLKEFDLEGFVNIDEASKLPLPLLLKDCSLHVSKFSGSIAEAGIMQRKSLIIDEIGVDTYKELISSDMAIKCLSHDVNTVIGSIEDIILKETYDERIIKKESRIQYKTIINNFIN